MIKKIIKKFIPNFLLSFYHYFLAFLGAVVFRFPSQKLIVIGVTGTSGKSTTVDFITRILEEAGNTVASISSIRFKVGNQEWKNELKMTMPGRFKIQQLLRQAVGEKCKYAVLEVTSEGIKQFRHTFIHFNTAVFTNLSPEHIESHGGFENYRNEKLKLFKVTTNTHVLNVDDENAQYFWNIPAKETWIFGIEKQKSQTMDGRPLFETNIKAENVEIVNGIIKFSVDNVEFHLNLLGDFNIYNALAAISVGLLQGVSLDTCRKALEKVKGISGRMEIVARDPFLVVVDYAHTPEQLKSIYETLSNPKFKIPNPKQYQNSPSHNSRGRENYGTVKNSKLICVLGSCGGGRDKWKRPVLGRLATQYCKEIIITNEDPYDEDPLEIMEQVASGVGEREHHIVLDRKEAIKKAVTLATLDDVVVITGKGSETLMCLENGKKISWSDKDVVLTLLSHNQPTVYEKLGQKLGQTIDKL